MSAFKCIAPRSSSKISDDCSRLDAERFDVFPRMGKGRIFIMRVHGTSIPRRCVAYGVVWGCMLRLLFLHHIQHMTPKQNFLEVCYGAGAASSEAKTTKEAS